MRRLAAASAVLALILVACGGSGSATSAPPSAQTAPQTQPESSGSSSQATALGTNVLITGAGFQPLLLVAPMGEPITWKNVSSSTQSVHLDNFGRRVDSGPIHPGDAWTFNPKVLASITYHSTYGDHFKGQLQIQLPGFG